MGARHRNPSPADYAPHNAAASEGYAEQARQARDALAVLDATTEASPGPWEIHNGYVYAPGSALTTVEVDGEVRPHRTGLIALVYFGLTPGIGSLAPNARLIRAAPEMLAALENALWLLDQPTPRTDEDREGQASDAIKIEREIRAAIASAKGDQA